MKKLKVAFASILLLGAVAVFAVAHRVDSFMDTPLAVAADGVGFEIPAGSSFTSVSRELLAKGLISDDTWLRLYVRWHDQAKAIQAGDYWIAAGTSPRSLLHQFTSGAVRLFAFTLVEGWNYREVLQALHANSAVKATMTDEDWPALLESLGADVTHPEGLFLPETYRFPRHTSDRALLGQAYALMQDVLAEEWQNRGETAAVKSAYEALVLASIV